MKLSNHRGDFWISLTAFFAAIGLCVFHLMQIDGEFSYAAERTFIYSSGIWILLFALLITPVKVRYWALVHVNGINTTHETPIQRRRVFECFQTV
jgi:hypothetical protein